MMTYFCCEVELENSLLNIIVILEHTFNNKKLGIYLQCCCGFYKNICRKLTQIIAF